MKNFPNDLGLGAGLAVIAWLMRAPFVSRYLYHWDSVNFALSLTHYDVRLHQPHPPGYYLYAMLGRLANLVIPEANAAFAWLSLIAGGLGVALLYWLSARMFSRPAGVAVAMLAMTSPQHWFHSEVALSYTLEFLMVTAVAGLCYRQLSDRPGLWPITAVVLGVAGGIRQNDLVFMLPVWLVSLWPLTWRQRLASLVILGVVIGAWAWPMLALSGGPSGYWAALSAETKGVAEASPFSRLGELLLNGGRLGLYIGYGVLLGLIPLAWGVWHIKGRWRRSLRDRRAWVLLLWIAPALLFYLVIHIRQPGHIFTFLPALLLLAGGAAWELGQRMFVRARAWPWTPTALIVASNLSFFLFMPPALFGSRQLPLQTTSRQTIAQRDQQLGERVDYIRAQFDPAHTAILAGEVNFRHPDYYLPDYQMPGLSYGLGATPIPLSTSVQTLVLFDERSLPDLRAGPELQQVTFLDGTRLRYLVWPTGQTAQLSNSTFQLMPR